MTPNFVPSSSSSPTIEERIAQVVREAIAPLRGEILEHVTAALRQVTPPATPREWLSTGDVAAELDVTPDTVRQWVKKGKLRATPGTRYLRIHRSELRRFLAGEECADASKVENLAARLRRIR